MVFGPLDRIIVEFVGSASARNVEFLKKLGDNGYTSAFGRFLYDILCFRSYPDGTWGVPLLQRFVRAVHTPLTDVLRVLSRCATTEATLDC